jgi:hypothetical protein
MLICSGSQITLYAENVGRRRNPLIAFFVNAQLWLYLCMGGASIEEVSNSSIQNRAF